MTDNIKIGICFGGYCPLHQGHLDVIMQAKKESDICYVVVCGYESEPRGLDLNKDIVQRTQMVKEFFRGDETIHVISANDTELGLDESMSQHNWKVWTDYVMNMLCKDMNISSGSFSTETTSYNSWIKSMFDVCFYVGEKRYVDDLTSVGYDSVLVGYDPNSDSHRVNNISATLIRENPQKYWNKITYPFKPCLTKKILVIGTASEGKTTLVHDIAKYFNMPYTTEYGRDYMEKKNMLDPDLHVNDFMEFLIGQRKYYFDALKNMGNPGVIISDTDNLVTLMYAKAYVDNPEMPLTQDDYNTLYNAAKSLQTDVTWDKIYLIKPHNKFVDDGSRYMGQSSIDERMKNYNILVELLKDFNLYDKVEILNGTYLEHFNAVKNYINSLYI